jgi:hypothetical protein
VKKFHHRWRQRRLRLYLDGAGVPYDVSFILYQQLTVFGCVEPHPGWWPTRHEASTKEHAEYSAGGGKQITKHITKTEKSRYVREFWEPVLSMAREKAV